MKKLLPVIIIAVGLIFSFYVYKELVRLEEQHRNETAINALNILESELDSILKSRFFVSEAMKSFISINPDLNAEEFSIFAETLLTAHPPVRAIQYADSDTRVTYVYPAAGNEITITNPMVLIDDPKRGRYVSKAIEEKRATLQPPFTLRQGGIGMVLRNPIFIDNVFAGLSIIVIDLDKIIEEVYSADKFAGFEIGYYSEDGKFLFGSELPAEDSISRRISLADDDWEIRLKNSDAVPTYQILIWLLLIFLIFTGLSIIIFITINRGEYLQKQVEMETSMLRESNHELNKQIRLRTESEKQARNLLEEKKLLLKEIHHRLKNNLNSIRSLLCLQEAETENAGIKKSLGSTIARIDSLKELYIRLLETENYKQLNVETYLKALIGSIQNTIQNIERIDFQIDIDDFALDTKIIFPLGIITNELITNAAKYAFPDNRRGRITIDLQNLGASFLYVVSDNGIGETSKEEYRKKHGFGINLVKMLVEQIDGKLDISSSDGYTYSLRAPLNSNADLT